MRKIVLSLVALGFLGACAPSGVWSKANGKPEYVWIGCHDVVVNPSDTGEIAFGPFGLKVDKIFFKQVNKDGSVTPTTTGVPCEQ
jgi:hypothetical protein|tara:strand:- start:239 stop:493 length:255 start_codon:yes stop_codon:yes gene_type:complete